MSIHPSNISEKAESNFKFLLQRGFRAIHGANNKFDQPFTFFRTSKERERER